MLKPESSTRIIHRALARSRLCTLVVFVVQLVTRTTSSVKHSMLQLHTHPVNPLAQLKSFIDRKANLNPPFSHLLHTLLNIIVHSPAQSQELPEFRIVKPQIRTKQDDIE